MIMEINGKTVLITGANRGIGAALVQAFLNAGVAKLYAGARNPAQLPAFNDARVVPLKLDITKPADVSAAVKAAGDVDLLVNNAGVAKAGNIMTSSAEDLAGDMDINYYGTVRMMQAFAPALEKREPAFAVRRFANGVAHRFENAAHGVSHQPLVVDDEHGFGASPVALGEHTAVSDDLRGGRQKNGKRRTHRRPLCEHARRAFELTAANQQLDLSVPIYKLKGTISSVLGYYDDRLGGQEADSTQLLQPRLASIKATLDRRYLIATSRRHHWSMNRWTRHQHAPSTLERLSAI